MSLNLAAALAVRARTGRPGTTTEGKSALIGLDARVMLTSPRVQALLISSYHR